MIQLEIVRIGVGLALLAAYAPVTGRLPELYGSAGWISPEAVAGTYRGAGPAGASLGQAACLTLVRLQVAVIFFFAGVEKLRGDSWWGGWAVWVALANPEFANVPLAWFAQHLWVVNLMTYATPLAGLASPLLLWGG